MVDALGIEYSLKMAIESEAGITSKIISSELEHPKTFPYVYIRNVPSNHVILSKGRETIESTYNFEILLYNESKYEMSENRRKIMRMLMFNSFKYYTSNGEETNRFIEVNADVFESPAYVNITENLTSYYQVSYDFEVVATHHKN